MSSKSSSGSLVKSVESILPKGVNLKHVLLAVLVGLLLCMMFGQTVEGYQCTIPNPTAPYSVVAGATAPTGPVGTDNDVAIAPESVTNWSAGDTGKMTYDNASNTYECAAGYTGDVVLTCNTGSAGDAEFSGCTRSDLACTTTSGPYRASVQGGAAAGSSCAAYCNSSNLDVAGNVAQVTVPTLVDGVADITTSNGVCDSAIGGLSNLNTCAKFIDEDSCKARAAANGCTWTSIRDYAQTHSERSLYAPLLSSMKYTRYGCGTSSTNALGDTDALERSQITDALPIQLGTNNADDIAGAATLAGVTPEAEQKSWKGLKGASSDSKYYDFFYLLLGDAVDNTDSATGKKAKVSQSLSNSSVLPEEIKTPMIEKVKQIEQLWDDYDEDGLVLEKNGGRVIAGYNNLNGLVIRNSPTEPIVLPGINKSWHNGPGCSGTWDSTNKEFNSNASDVTCRMDTPCHEILSNLSDLSAADRALGVTTYCSLPSCSTSDQLPECAGNRAIDDAVATARNTLQGFLSAI